ncbi:unnamed protein product, partial [Brenthis ino]
MITVGLKPKFLNEEETNIVFSEGSTAILGCGAISIPPPTVKWYHNDREIDETSMERYFKMNLSDIGNFTCKISNAFGEITRTFNINLPISQGWYYYTYMYRFILHILFLQYLISKWRKKVRKYAYKNRYS